MRSPTSCSRGTNRRERRGNPSKAQKEKSVPGDIDVNCPRFRGHGGTLDSDPKMKVTQGAKKDAENSKDQNIVYTKKLRAGSHWDSEDIQERH